MFQAKALYTRR